MVHLVIPDQPIDCNQSRSLRGDLPQGHLVRSVSMRTRKLLSSVLEDKDTRTRTRIPSLLSAQNTELSLGQLWKNHFFFFSRVPGR